jgi:SIR2-like protein
VPFVFQGKLGAPFMSVREEPPELGVDDFTRRFALRAANLMWFLGAGASASAGIPTAWDMVWEFKQLLYVSQRRVALQSVADLSNPAIRAQLQAHIDAAGTLPAAGSPEEYAGLFEAAYPAESDRRAFRDAKLTGAKPSYRHLALAVLMRAQRSRLVWTTNFDPLVADSCAKIFGTTGTLTSVALDAPDLARQVIGEGRWPVEVKLHGDFRSRRLKNTNDELRQQDARLRQLLVEACGRFGLVAAGYSGRDGSIMDTLDEAASRPGAFPAGLFWLHRGDDAPLPRVGALLARDTPDLNVPWQDCNPDMLAWILSHEHDGHPTRAIRVERRLQAFRLYGSVDARLREPAITEIIDAGRELVPALTERLALTKAQLRALREASTLPHTLTGLFRNSFEHAVRHLQAHDVPLHQWPGGGRPGQHAACRESSLCHRSSSGSNDAGLSTRKTSPQSIGHCKASRISRSALFRLKGGCMGEGGSAVLV